MSDSKKRIPWNKGRKESEKHVYYTNGIISIRLKESDIPPEGFYRGRIVKWSEEAKQAKSQKTKQTKLERYGDAKYNNLEKAKQTKLDRYGSETFNNVERTKQTNLDKYGVENVFQSAEVKEKIKQTNLERYGYSGSFANPEILDKAIQNSTSEVAKEKRKQTCLERYNTEYAGNVFGIPRSRSKINETFKTYLISTGIKSDDIVSEFSLGKYRYDFKVNNTLIEINPTITHNSTLSIFDKDPKEKDYHYLKSQIALQNGYRCIHVWDWDDYDKILKLLVPQEKIYARKCTIKNVSKVESHNFLNEYHLQGDCRSAIKIGLYYNNELVSLMTFGKSRYNKNYEYELIRYCSSKQIIGGAEKLFTYFVKTYNPKSIISYCDLSKFTGNVYPKLGFIYVKTSISKHWYNIKTKKHILDSLLLKHGFDRLFKTDYGKGTDNKELMLENNFLEIYDAGQAIYIWTMK